MASNDDSYEAEISSLFKDALYKLDKIDAQAERERKEIVKNLAKDLEGKIATDTISIEIVNQLRGRVSERHIRECLDEKYKQKHRVENARKQKRQEHDDNSNLAAVTPLDQEAKNKELIVDVHGREETFVAPSSAKQSYPNSLETAIECNGCAQLRNEKQNIQTEKNVRIRNLEEKLKQIYDDLKQKIADNSRLADKIRRLESDSTGSNSSYQSINQSNSRIDIEFPILFDDLYRRMYSIHKVTKGIGKIFFHFTVDTSSRKAVLIDVKSKNASSNNSEGKVLNTDSEPSCYDGNSNDSTTLNGAC